MSRFVQRDGDGKIIGHYANPQSYASEELPDDHPDLAAFTEARKPKIKENRLEAIAAALVAKGLLSNADIDQAAADIKAKKRA